MDELSTHDTTKTSSGQNEESDSFAERMYFAALTVDKYYTPLLFIFGTLGNSLSLAVFCMNAKYRSQSASYYLSALAISDTGFLVNLLAVWLESVHGGIITSGLMCPIVMYLGQVTCFISVYLTVAFSIERYVAVHYPLSRPRICTRSKARKIIAALTGVALLFFSYAWVIAQVIELPSSSRREDYDELNRENLTPMRSYNLSQDSSTFPPFPVGRKGKSESFPFTPTAKLATSYEQDVRRVGNTHVFGKVQNCGTGSQNSYNKSIHFSTQNQSPNCTRLHLDGTALKGFRTSYRSPESSSSEESFSASVEKTYDAEKNLTDEDFFLSGGYICSVPKDYFRISEIANYLDSVVTLIIPFFLITFFNVRIAICVWKLQRQRQNIIATSGGSASNINHHYSLKCSNKGGMHHKRKSSTKKRSSRKRQHLSEEQCNHFLEKNGVGKSNSLESDFEEAYNSKSQKVVVRFQDTSGRCTTRTTSGQSNKAMSSSSGSEENSLVENCEFNNASTPGNADIIRGLNTTTKRMDRAEALKATPKILGKSTSAGSRFGSGTGMKWEEKHRAIPSRVTAEPEFSVTREKGSSSHHPASNAAEVRVTKTLLLVSSVFLVLNLPSHAIRCAQFIQSLRGISEGHELLQAAQMWTNILFNTNFAVNFLLYCLSGRNFRKSLRNLILRKCNNNKPPNSWKGMSKSEKQGSIAVTTKLMRGKVGTPPRRSCTKELQVTEIVELEERGEAPIYPNNNVGTVTHEVNQEADASMPV